MKTNHVDSKSTNKDPVNDVIVKAAAVESKAFTKAETVVKNLGDAAKEMAAKGVQKAEEVTHTLRGAAEKALHGAQEIASKAEKSVHEAGDKVIDKIKKP